MATGSFVHCQLLGSSENMWAQFLFEQNLAAQAFPLLVVTPIWDDEGGQAIEVTAVERVD